MSDHWCLIDIHIYDMNILKLFQCCVLIPVNKSKKVTNSAQKGVVSPESERYAKDNQTLSLQVRSCHVLVFVTLSRCCFVMK